MACNHPLATTTAAPQKAYSGVEGARKLLNDMIYESMSKYDAEILQVRRLTSSRYSNGSGARRNCSVRLYCDDLDYMKGMVKEIAVIQLSKATPQGHWQGNCH